MRSVAFALLAVLLGSQTALAQNSVRYFTSVTGLMDDLESDAIVKETRSGAKLVSAELDVCYAPAPNSPLRDRFVVALKPQGKNLTGTGQSQDSKTPVSVDLIRNVSGDTVSFEGTIKFGNRTLTADSTDNSDMSAKDFDSQNAVEETITDVPADFQQVTPGTIAMRVSRTALVDALNALRAEKVRVQASSIAPSCDALRRGTVDVQIDVDPERAAALVAKLKSLPGVTRSGWTAGGIDLSRSLRLPAAPWRDAAGKLEREKLGKALAEAASKALAGKSAAFEWDDVTGELVIAVKRPDVTLPGLGLVETVEATFVVSGEKPGAPDPLVVRIGQFSGEIEDDGDGPRLTLGTSSSEGGSPEPVGADGVQAAIAKELKAERWDPDKEIWVK